MPGQKANLTAQFFLLNNHLIIWCFWEISKGDWWGGPFKKNCSDTLEEVVLYRITTENPYKQLQKHTANSN